MSISKKLISFVVPCYGKTNEVVRESLKTLDKQLALHSDKIEVIFVYKNLNAFDYDWVKEEFPNFTHIKIEDNSRKRTFKIKKGLEVAKGKYFYPFDPDDALYQDDFNDLLALFESSNADVFLFDYISKRVDKNSQPTKRIVMSKKGHPIIREFNGFPGNYCFAYKTEHFMKYINDYKIDDFLWFNDNYMILISTQLAKLECVNKVLLIYNRGFGDSMLSSHYKPQFITHFETMYKQIIDFQYNNSKDIRKINNKQYQTMLNTYYISLLMNEGHIKAIKKANNLTNEMYTKGLLTRFNKFKIKTFNHLTVIAKPILKRVK